jgi:ribosome recycling factor
MISAILKASTDTAPRILQNVKHLAKLIQSTVYSLNPRIDPENTNPNLIVVEVPPATAESRARVIEEVSQLSNRVNRYITAARANQQKRHRQMRLNKIARPDDIDKGMFACNDLCKAANEEQKAITEKFKKAVQGSGETIDKKTWNNRNNFLARNKTLN